MTVVRPISGIFRGRLRRRAALSLTFVLINASASFAALKSRGYHFGFVKSPFISPIAFDVGLRRLAVNSECVQWVDIKEDNFADRYCREVVAKLDNLSLDEAARRVCNDISYLNVSTVGTICSTLSALRMAGNCVVMILTITLLCDASMAALIILIGALASDPFVYERRARYNPVDGFLGDFMNQSEAQRLDGLREAYDRQSLQLSTLRSAVRVGLTLCMLLFFWAPTLYPLLGENIHMNSMPIYNMWHHHTLASDGTTLSIGFVILCLACAIRFCCSLAVLFLLSPVLTLPLALQKQAMAKSTTGKYVKYDGFDDMIAVRDSIRGDPFARARDLKLTDQIVDQEMNRLLTSNISATFVAGAATSDDDW